MIGRPASYGSAQQLAQQYQSGLYPGWNLPVLHTTTFEDRWGKWAQKNNPPIPSGATLFGDLAGSFMQQASGALGAPLRITIEHPPMSDGQVEVTARKLQWGDADLDTPMSVQTSHESGNCWRGSVEWVKKHLGDPSGVYTVRQVLGAALASGDRVDDAMRACWGAILFARGQNYSGWGAASKPAADPSTALFLSPAEIAELRKSYPGVGDKKFNQIVKQREAAMRKAASEARKNQEKLIRAQGAASAQAGGGFDWNAAVANVTGAASDIYGGNSQGLNSASAPPPPPQSPPPAAGPSPAMVGAIGLGGLLMVGAAVAVKRRRRKAAQVSA